jgi:AraC-type DNA-binding domain-containing proteins
METEGRQSKSSPSRIYGLKDLQILDDIREVFFTTTGLAVSCHYPGFKDYDFYPIVEKNPYCALVQGSEEGLERCLRSDQEALSAARSQGASRCYVCHAGLVNVVIPLSYKGKDLGALFFGQLAPAEGRKEAFEAARESLSGLGIDDERLRRSYERVKSCSDRELNLATRLLSLLSNYILSVEEEFCLRSELYEKEREILRYENTQMKLRNDLQQLSIRILEDKILGAEPGGSRPDGRQRTAVVARAREFVAANYARDISVPEVARAVYLSPNYFSTIFKEVTGRGFSEYLSEVRIEQGRRMLRETDEPIKTIVEAIGYKDYNYFNRTFKRLMGVPPAEYRRSGEGGKR